MNHSTEKQHKTHKSINDTFPMYSIFIFILLISAGEILNIFPCSVIGVIKNNIYLQHFIGFLTMTFFVVLVVPIPDKKLNNILSKSALMYAIFILITKTESHFFIPIIVLLGATYLLILKKVEYRESIERNENVSSKTDTLNKINTIVLINNSILIVIAVLLIIGFILYLGRKKYEYGKDFSYITFMFGRNVCSKTLPTISYNTSLHHLFD
jgi:hypothetical protein